MRVLLVDADSHNGFPNLALMKISSFLKEINNGDLTLDLIKGIPDTAPLEEYDQVYVSTIFYQNKERLRNYLRQLPSYEVGGSGWDLDQTLPESIEHILPDYSLYDIDYSMGLTSRGCIRNCGFCIVPQKEGKIKDHAPISEFHHPTHKKIMLLDNNFLASPNMAANFDYILENNLKVNFNQGLDIRLVTEDIANVLSEVKYFNWTFKTRGLHFAFDSWRYREHVEEGIKTLIDAGINPNHLMFYVLIGYDTDPKNDFERVELLKSYGVKPYVMTYNQKESLWSKHFERWVNGRYHEFIPFEKYSDGVLASTLQECEKNC